MTSVLFRGLPWRDDTEAANQLQDHSSLFIGDGLNAVTFDIARGSMLFRSAEPQSEDEQPDTESEISTNTAATEDSLHWEDVEVPSVALSNRRLAKTGTRHLRISEISILEFERILRDQLGEPSDHVVSQTIFAKVYLNQTGTD